MPLVAAIPARDAASEISLYALCLTYRPWVRSRLHDDTSLDIIHDAYVVVLEALRAGRIRKLQHLSLYTWKVIRRKTLDYCCRDFCANLPKDVWDSKADGPLAQLLENEHATKREYAAIRLERGLNKINQRRAKLLRLLFFEEMRPVAIREIMGLSQHKMWNEKYRGLVELGTVLNSGAL